MKILQWILKNSTWLLLIVGMVFTSIPFALEKQIQFYINATSGAEQRRFKAWLKIIKSNRKTTDKKKLEKVNSFFNLFAFQSDRQYMGAADVWKTPEEFVSDGGGDCEDYAIAKYFTLQALGVPMDKLRITYVKSKTLNQAHMVLSYYPTPESDPLILDNLDSKIKTASKRPDLVPVYSFNTQELWLAGPSYSSKHMGTNNLKKWKGVINRMHIGGVKYETQH
jgi:predicted transglutaminase-like cysteine proteinase